MAIPASVSLPSAAPVAPKERKAQHWLQLFFLTLWVGMALVPLVWGWTYYVTPLEERGYSSLHDMFKPSGVLGHTMGVFGSLMMLVGVGMYSLRKRVRILRRAGKLGTWLNAHIFLCTLGPVLVMLHTSFKIGGMVSISFWSMAMVVASGVVGRYVYVRIPKTINGQFASAEMIAREKEILVDRMVREGGVVEGEIRSVLARLERRIPTGLIQSLIQSIVHDWSVRSRRRSIVAAIEANPVARGRQGMLVELVEHHLKLQHQFAVMRSFRRLFGYWHVFHLPLAIVMFLIMFIHIAVTALFGYAWVL